MSDSIDDLMSEVAANKPTKKFDQYVFDNEDALVEAINKKCQLIAFDDGTKFVFRNNKGEPRIIGRRDAEIELAQYQLVYEIEKKDGTKTFKTLPGFGIWLKSERRKKYEGQVFLPNEDTGEVYLNMWTGFAVEPKEGDWSLLKAHVRENICNGNEEDFRYLMAWMAQLFKDPGHKIGVAVVLRGKKGVGKSTLSVWIRNIIGPRHAMVAEKKEQWTGRFTSQLERRIFLGCEEGLFAGSHEQDSSIKHLISSEDFSYEAKGKDITSGKNYTRVFVTTNEDWAVPATPGERRFFVQDVATTHVEDTQYFTAIDEQMKAGGAAAMLYELLKSDYSGIDLRKPPKTEALKDQIEIGLKANLAWLASVLSEGEFPFLDRTRPAVEWPDRLVVESGEKPTKEALDAQEARRDILKVDVRESYRDFVPGRRDRPVTDSAVGRFMTKHVPDVEGVRKRVKQYERGVGVLTPHYRLPWLSDARAAFLKANPGVVLAQPDKVIEDDKNTSEAEQDCSSPVTPLAGYRRARY